MLAHQWWKKLSHCNTLVDYNVPLFFFVVFKNIHTNEYITNEKKITENRSPYTDTLSTVKFPEVLVLSDNSLLPSYSILRESSTVVR